MRRAIANLILSIAFYIRVAAVRRFLMDLESLNDGFSELIQDRAQQLLIQQNLGGGAGNFQNVLGAVSNPPTNMSNLLRDADLNMSDESYRLFTYTTPDLAGDVPAFWYSHANTSAAKWIDSLVGTESGDAIRPILAVSDGSITASSKNLSTVSPIFATGQTSGFTVFVQGAGAAGADLITTMDTFTDSTHCVLHVAASTTVGPNALVRVYPTGINTGWRKDRGEIEWGGNGRLATFLAKKFVAPGVANDFYYLGAMILNADLKAVALTAGYQLRVAIWDNSTGILKIIDGGTINASAQRTGASGSVTRHYVIKYITANDFWYSSVSSPASVINTVDPVTVSPNQVQVTFPTFTGVVTYEIYRSDSVAGLSNYYRIAVIDTGINVVQDNGGRAIGPFTFAGDKNQQAAAYVKNFAALLTDMWFSFTAHILTPAGYNVGATTDGQQMLIIDVVDENQAVVTIPDFAIRIDRMALGYLPGNWSPSAYDQAAPGDFVFSGPDPNGGNPSGGTGDPGSGGGGGPIDRGQQQFQGQ